MDAFPTYSDFVVLVANIAFILCYTGAIFIHVLKSIKNKYRFTIIHVVFSLFVGLCGSTLAFVTVYFIFGKT